jgi:O-acetyl-ADP-ribose deacetylase (regulator of RNase III)
MPHSFALRVVLVDVNPAMVHAWREVFDDTPDVQFVHGSMLEQRVDAWVTPTNARGLMDGGLDAVLKRHFGARIEQAVQQEIARRFDGILPVGAATCVSTGLASPRFLISAPTMDGTAEDIRETDNVALACAAAFQAIHQQNRLDAGAIRSVALPGLGASTGRVPVRTCARLMWTAFNLFKDYEFRNFATLRAALAGHSPVEGVSSGSDRFRVELPAENDWLR